MNRKSTYYVRILAGGYLLYLGYSLVKSTLTEHLTKVYLAFGLVFAGLGLVIGGSALLAVHRIEKEEREGAGNQEPYEGEQPEENTGLLEETKDKEKLSIQEDTKDDEAVPEQEELRDGGDILVQEDGKTVPQQEEQTSQEKEEKVQ